MSKTLIKLLNYRNICRAYSTSSVKLIAPHLDENYLCDHRNSDEITKNIANRKGVGNIKLVHELNERLKRVDANTTEYKHLYSNYLEEILKIPNQSHPQIIELTDEPKLIKTINAERKFAFKPRDFYTISRRLNMARTEQMGNVSGSKSYTILGELVEMEQALINYTLKRLLSEQFKLVSVPDVIDKRIVRACGMCLDGDRTQIYQLDHALHGNDLCLSGTSELALAGYFANKVLTELPTKVAAVSRCYRAETSNLAEEKGIFRVHQFTKVEMFVVCAPNQSDRVLEELRRLEEALFTDLGLFLRVLDMPPHELGAQAYRKYDIEAWMPGRGMFGEISSCSNCTDYQTRRLNIKLAKEGNSFAHSLNGTACAIPRMLIALIETYQNDDGTIDVPRVLQPFMRNKTKMGKQKRIPELKLIKNKKK